MKDRFDTARWFLRRTSFACIALTGVLFAGCETLFDAPPSEATRRQEAALKKMNDLASTGEQKAGGLKEVGADPARALTNVAGKAAGSAGSSINARSRGKEGGTASAPAAPGDTFNGREIPSMSFEHVEADMPHLAVLGLEEAVFLVDGRRIELGGMTRAGRIGLVAPGNHVLRIECPRGPPFSADFYLQKNERAVVRGSCSPPDAVNDRR
ncbi:MAG: hypothetical protein LBT71_06635 [Azoarcus sp.]|jgi:hypothetical protein|nr:hypothetical protein [Azoarcus sp.]